MSTVLVRYRFDRTGQAVPIDGPMPPDHIPWPHAPLVITRTELDYGPGYVRPRDSITVRADEEGAGEVWLSPGRYRIALPGRDTRDVTLSAEPAEIDLSALLAGGIEPEDPAYPTLLALIQTALEPVPGAVADAEQAAQDAAQAAQEARDAAEPLTEQREAAEAAAQAAEAAADLAEERADRTPQATLAELPDIEPLPGRIRYVPEIGRPAWADGTEWRVAQGWLADFSRLRIIDTLYSEAGAAVYLNIAPYTPPPGARE